MIAFLFHLKKSSQSTSAFYECFTVPHSNVQRLQVMRPTYTVQQIRPPHGSSGSADDGKIQHLIVSQQQPATGIAQQQQQQQQHGMVRQVKLVNQQVRPFASLSFSRRIQSKGLVTFKITGPKMAIPF